MQILTFRLKFELQYKDYTEIKTVHPFTLLLGVIVSITT